MKKHTKIYFEALDYKEGDYIPSELSGSPAVDIHHIISRGRSGQDRIENLMALTREEHIRFGDKKDKTYFLLVTHQWFLDRKGIDYYEHWFKEQRQKYEDKY